MENGYIKHWRKEKESYVWSLKPEYYKVWQTILLNVNWRESQMDFCGGVKTVEPGQMVTGQNHLAELASGDGENAKITRQNVRTALEKFEQAGMITRESTSEGTLLTVCNWGEYQGNANGTNHQVNQQLTSEQPATNQRLTTYEERKKGKKGNKEKNTNGISDEARSLFDYWQQANGTMTHNTNKTEHRKAIQRRLDDGFDKDEIKEAIKHLSELYQGKHDTWLTTTWTCREFFTRKSGEHLEKMINTFEHFLKESNGGGSNGQSGRPGPKSNLQRATG